MDPVKKPEATPQTVTDCSSEVFTLITTNYPDMPWPLTQQALQLVHHDLLIRSQTYETAEPAP